MGNLRSLFPTTFETFAFPWPPGREPSDDPRVEAIGAAARELVRQRDEWLASGDRSLRTSGTSSTAAPSNGMPAGTIMTPALSSSTAAPSSVTPAGTIMTPALSSSTATPSSGMPAGTIMLAAGTIMTPNEVLAAPNAGSAAPNEASAAPTGTISAPTRSPQSPTPNLKDRTLTNLYNKRPDWLDMAHRRLDEAVFAAYGWPADLNDEEILARLLALNLERAAGQAALAAGAASGADNVEQE